MQNSDALAERAALLAGEALREVDDLTSAAGDHFLKHDRARALVALAQAHATVSIAHSLLELTASARAIAAELNTEAEQPEPVRPRERG